MDKLLIFIFLLASMTSYAQNISINENGDIPDLSAILDISSETKGVLLPRMKSSERKSIVGPQTGLLVYDLNLQSLFYFNGNQWVEFASSRQGLRDSDFDTYISVEKAIDDDSIRMVAAGVDKLIIHDAGIRYLSDNENLALGNNIMEAGANNLVIGNNSNLHNSISPNENVVIGNGAFSTINSGNDDENVAIGFEAGSNITFGSRNVIVGFEAFHSGSGYSNVSIGSDSGKLGDGFGERNVFIGQSAGSSASSSHYDNIAIGSHSGLYAQGGWNNISIGESAGFSGLEFSSNKIAIGNNAGRLSLTGDNSIFIGKSTGSNMTLCDDCILIGNNAGFSGFFSNSLMIDNETTLNPLILGNFELDYLKVNGDFDVVHGDNGDLYGFKVVNSNGGNYWKFYTRSSNGNLRLYNTANGTNYVAWIDDASGAYNSVSDRRVKKDFSSMSNVTSSLAKLEILKYRYKTEGDTAQKHIGLIAQDVEEYFPELVNYDAELDLYTINYDGLGPIAIKGIQEMNEENVKLKLNVDSMNKEIETLRFELAEIKKMLEGM